MVRHFVFYSNFWTNNFVKNDFHKNKKYLAWILSREETVPHQHLRYNHFHGGSREQHCNAISGSSTKWLKDALIVRRPLVWMKPVLTEENMLENSETFDLQSDFFSDEIHFNQREVLLWLGTLFETGPKADKKTKKIKEIWIGWNLTLRTARG